MLLQRRVTSRHLGKHIVLCGDSTNAECYDTLMDGTKANLVLSDPPYNVDVEEMLVRS